MIPCGLSCNCQLCDLIAPDVDEHVLMWWGEWWGPERELTCACTNFVAYCLLTIVIVERGTHNMKVSCGWTNDDSISSDPSARCCVLVTWDTELNKQCYLRPPYLRNYNRSKSLYCCTLLCTKRTDDTPSYRVSGAVELQMISKSILWSKPMCCETNAIVVRSVC